MADREFNFPNVGTCAWPWTALNRIWIDVVKVVQHDAVRGVSCDGPPDDLGFIERRAGPALSPRLTQHSREEVEPALLL